MTPIKPLNLNFKLSIFILIFVCVHTVYTHTIYLYIYCVLYILLTFTSNPWYCCISSSVGFIPYNLSCSIMFSLKGEIKSCRSPRRTFFLLRGRRLHLSGSRHTDPSSGSTWIGRQSRSCHWASETEPERERPG